MRRTDEELKRLIEHAQRLRYEEGFSVTEIANTMDISITAASNWSRGNSSSRKSRQEYLEQRANYEAVLIKRLEAMEKIGYDIQDIHIGKSVIFRFVKKGLPSRETKGRVIQIVHGNLVTLELEELLEGIEFHYRDGKHYMRPHTIASKAFIHPYAELVLSRELVK